MNVPASALKIGQVFFEDDEFITLKIAKTEDVTFDLEMDDEFFTLLFVQRDGDGIRVWDPLENR